MSDISEKDGFDYIVQTLVNDWDPSGYHVCWENILSLEPDKATVTRAFNEQIEWLIANGAKDKQEKAKYLKNQFQLDSQKGGPVYLFWAEKMHVTKLRGIEKKDSKLSRSDEAISRENEDTFEGNLPEFIFNTTQETNQNAQFDSVPCKRSSDDDLNQNFKKRLLGFDYYSDSSTSTEEEKSKTEAEDSDEEGERITNFSKFTFDEYIDTLNEKGWVLSDGEKMIPNIYTLTTDMHMYRLGLSSIIDLSSEFDEGMYMWFGKDWGNLKAKVSEKINFKVKKFEGDALSDIIKIEELCASYHYWEARIYLLDKLKERHIDNKHQQVLKIYYHLIDMLLANPYSFVNKEGGKKNLTEMEYIMKISGPILEIIFSNNHDIVYLKWGETVSKSAVNRKIDLKILTTDNDLELSHSEFARKATLVKIIKDAVNA
ncbi:4825_t:CDS:2 [Entrophospora sp. SA101]|nr:4825_t:CDS:2 [Entrophospora sp. SA101]